MDDNDAKIRAAPKGSAVKPGAIAEGGDVESSTNVRTTTPPENMCQAEHDILAKQQAVNTAIGEPMKPGAVAVGGFEQSNGSHTTGAPGAIQQAPNSRLVAKLRGELPENFNTAAPGVSTLERRENEISKLREAEPPVNSKLVDRENQVQSKIRGSDPPVNSKLMDREDQIQSKIRTTENETPSSIPGALARLSTLEDAVTSKQDSGHALLSVGNSPPVQLQQREDIATAKSDQIARNLDDAPQRLQQVEMMLDRKMRDGTSDNANRSGKLAWNEEMEYGEYGGPHQTDLAVALAVDEEEGAGTYLPAAVEYDPDAKPPLYRSYRFRLYTCVAIVTVVIGTIGAVLGILLTIDEEELQPLNIQYRETLGIRENIELVVGAKEKLDDLSGPYRKALDWIMFDDAMALTPDSNRLAQRYIAAYLFFATSAKSPWSSGCNPPEDGEQDFCSYGYIQDNGQYSILKAKRWLSNTSECEWAGIKCDDLFQIREFDISTSILILITVTALHVSQILKFFFLCHLSCSFLHLGGSELSGTFPEGVMLLPFIQVMTFAHGKLEGPLPDYLPDAKHLVTISILNNTLTGTFPDHWLESRSFQRIILSDNEITGTITPNITALKDLKVLLLDGNSLDGVIPEEFGDILNLDELRLEQNSLIGSIPTQLGLLTGLEHLHLGRNKLTGTIPTEIGSMEILFSVRLKINLLTGPVPEQFWNSQRLTYVDLSENKLNGTVSGAIGRLPELYELIINDNQFSGSLPRRIASGSQGLKKIVATRNKLNGTVASDICDQREIKAAFKTLQLDCKVPSSGGTPEITCEEGCCTLCCDPDGENCVDV